MSEREVKRQACDDQWGDMSCTLLKGHKGMHIDERVFGEGKPSYADLAARLADAEARAEAAEAKVARVETVLDLWMSWKGERDHSRSSSPRGRDRVREALRGDQ